MDFGHLGFDTFNSVSNNGGSVLENGGEISKQQKWCGFGALKQQQQQQQERGVSEDDLRDSKMAKTTSCNEAMLRFPVQRYNGSEGHQQMLSFSSPYSHPVNFPYYPHGSSPFGRNTAGGINGGSMQMQQGLRGLFTASQWMELEHQALIYKYITANVPIPSYLLNPIRKAFESAGFLRSNALGWGGFQLGFANSDPEPGRCRRTDGKKWRCSRDAVAEQKYCERHMNRGRHRSRKPVEAQPTNSASTTATTNGKLAAAGGLSNLPKMQPTPTARLSAISTINRSVVDKEDTNDGAYHQHDLSSPKHHQTAAPSQESSFGLVCSDSLLNPLNRSSSLVNCKSQQHPLRQFMDDWPKTQLSISIPIATSDFMSSTSSPTKSPRELEMGLGVGPVSVERNQRQMNWVPLSMGGPLGEVLQECKSTKPLNLIDSWENSPRLASSPTGVLQRGAFGSVSNSSTASSPRAETGGSMNPGFMNAASLPAL